MILDKRLLLVSTFCATRAVFYLLSIVKKSGQALPYSDIFKKKSFFTFTLTEINLSLEIQIRQKLLVAIIFYTQT